MSAITTVYDILYRHTFITQSILLVPHVCHLLCCKENVYSHYFEVIQIIIVMIFFHVIDTIIQIQNSVMYQEIRMFAI